MWLLLRGFYFMLQSLTLVLGGVKWIFSEKVNMLHGIK